MAQELKAYNVVATADVNHEVVDNLGCTEFAAYDADEVDVVLAEKDAEIRRLKAQKAQAEDDCAYWKTMAQKNAADNAVMAKQRAEALKRESHQKYRLCLAMARWCNSEMGRETFACFRPRHTKEVWREEHEYWAKWHNRWLELAEKFKEAK